MDLPMYVTKTLISGDTHQKPNYTYLAIQRLT